MAGERDLYGPPRPFVPGPRPRGPDHCAAWAPRRHDGPSSRRAPPGDVAALADQAARGAFGPPSGSSGRHHVLVARVLPTVPARVRERRHESI